MMTSDCWRWIGATGAAVVLTTALPNAARTQQPAAPVAQSVPPPGCTGIEHRQFDFWIGSWAVHMPNGGLAGTNRIERAQDGCVLTEHWTGQGGGTGTSLNFYDRVSGKWNQVWIDNRGQALRLEGGWRDGAMVLEGVRPGPGGAEIKQRITWTPLPDKRVRQHWQTSADAGATWQTAFDGVYSREKP